MNKSLSFQEMVVIGNSYDAIVEMNYEKDCGERNGGAVSGNNIWLYECDEDWMMEISFWHELGHVLLYTIGESWGWTMSTLSHEGAAWEIGLKYASKHGRKWHYDSKELKWARKQLASYICGEYDDLPYTEKHFNKMNNKIKRDI